MHINLSGQLDNKTEISPLKSNIDCHMSNETNDMFSTALFLGIHVRFVGWKKRSLFIITTSNTQTIVDTTQRTKNPSKMTKIHWPQASSWSPPPPYKYGWLLHVVMHPLLKPRNRANPTACQGTKKRMASASSASVRRASVLGQEENHGVFIEAMGTFWKCNKHEH